ncbi:TaqI-like C-terminal specificity domain-containing protein [Candidatus Marithioploca araucensis]|uniref:site-specific DNA-methyltransferase (adenine-specific) n=1 Tax=Candidatus Marithioploca araucensis TaxID=70273 RepID=A0ABT7VPY1_9GAMM|nr:TaqI-like C-terminal specificity domain-containing protein [Candidatus Marithioploca araucensis]
MPIFQKSIIQKHLAHLEQSQLDEAFQRFKQNYNADKIQLIKTLKEEEYQDGFLRDIFVDVFGYTLKPDKNFNLVREFKNQTDGKKADGAILNNGNAIAVIELKPNKIKDLKSITQQAFNYKNNQPHCKYVITSNFQKLRFYIDYANEYEEFDLFNLDREAFSLLYLILNKDSLLHGLPLQLKDETKCHEENISAQFYKDYSQFKQDIFANLTKNNPQFDQLLLFKKSQKFLDRLLFVFFAEDTGLVTPNSIATEIENWETLQKLNAYDSLYNRLKKFFQHLNIGYQSSIYDIPAYNGGLFATDKILDQLLIDDDVLKDNLLKLATYDFNTELDVNILGHIFEHSLNELEEVSSKIEGRAKKNTKRKKDGIFYTPKYITQYIVENTLGMLCAEKRQELKLVDIEFDESYRKKEGSLSAKGQKLFKALEAYKKWLLQLKILDPACGSGAFLNQALNFLIAEHQEIDNIIADLTNAMPKFYDTDKMILEKNIFGVDINEESVEIAQLSLWLRTAKKGRTLSNLSRNIKCGHSLIDDSAVAGDKAFDWNKEFQKIMGNGGFDVVIGNPPYGVVFNNAEKQYLKRFDKLVPDYEIYIYFISLGIYKLLKPSGFLFYIIPNTFLSIVYGQKYREFLTKNYQIPYIVDLSENDVFADAEVRNCIFGLRKNNTGEKYTQFFRIEQINKTFWLNEILNQDVLSGNTENWLNLSFNRSVSRLITKLNKNQKLDCFFEVSQGLIPYDKYRGHSQETIEGRVFHADSQKDETYKKELKGGDIFRYQLNWNGHLWISYGKWIAAPRNPKFFVEKRVLIREITNCYLFCTYTEDEYYNTPSIINIIQKEKSLDLKYLLAILNSKMMGWYHNNTSPKAKKGLFPKILVNDVRNCPIKSLSKQQPFIEKADLMLALNKELQEKKTRFINRITSNLEIAKITKKLDAFYNFDFKTFVAELKKQKVKLTLVQQDEWEKYFAAYKTEIKQLQTQINATDKEIDHKVYALYGLTEEEIGIVES